MCLATRINSPFGPVACADADSTRELGKKLGTKLRAGDLVILDGPLGAGKTTLTQGIAVGMGVSGRVTSPTFVIARVHPSRGAGPDLVHVDAYRLIGDGETPLTRDQMAGALDSLDLDTDLEQAVVVAEWGKGFAEALASQWVEVSIDRTSAVADDPASTTRYISWRALGGGTN